VHALRLRRCCSRARRRTAAEPAGPTKPQLHPKPAQQPSYSRCTVVAPLCAPSPRAFSLLPSAFCLPCCAALPPLCAACAARQRGREGRTRQKAQGGEGG
jgi:hypothetical protein